jgi:hypothetical protein
MLKKQSWKLMAAILAVATLATVQAWARPMPRGGGFGGPGLRSGPGDRGMLHFGPLVEQLLFPCRNDCAQADHSCREAAADAALTCASQTCAAIITSAQTDCSTDRASQACLTDVSALITCVQPCLTAESTALSACAATNASCVAACNPTATPTPAP